MGQVSFFASSALSEENKKIKRDLNPFLASMTQRLLAAWSDLVGMDIVEQAQQQIR